MKKYHIHQFFVLFILLQACVYHDIAPETSCDNNISFDTTIAPIIQNNCAVGTCHNGNQFPDFREFGAIQQNAQRIKTQVINRTMPPDRTLTQEEIDAIACWVDRGTLPN